MPKVPKNPHAVALVGRLGGKKGGPARNRKLSAAQRKAIAKVGGLTSQGKDAKLVLQGRSALVNTPDEVHVIVDRGTEDAEGTER